MKKSPELKESPSKEPSPTTTLSRHRSNTFLRKLRRQLSSMSQWKECGKECNTYQWRLKSFTIQRGITTLLGKVNTSEVAMLRVDTRQLEQLMSRPKAESELKPFTKPAMSHPHHLSFKDPLSGRDLSKGPPNMALDMEPPLTPQGQFILDNNLTQANKDTPLDSKDTPPPATLLNSKDIPPDIKDIPRGNKDIPLDRPTSLEAVESEEKMFTDNHKLVMLLEEVESDNDHLYFILSSFFHHSLVFLLNSIILTYFHLVFKSIMMNS